MSIPLLMLLQLSQSKDSIGMRNAFRESIVAVESSLGSRERWIHQSEHIVIDVPSFLALIGVDSTMAPSWHSIIEGLGSRATDQAVTCEGGYKSECPHLVAVRMSTIGDELDLVMGVGYTMPRYGPTGKVSDRAVYFEMHVQLSRRGAAYHVDRVILGKET